MLAQYCIVLATHFPHLHFIVVQLVDGLPQEPALPQLPATQARCIKTSGPNCAKLRGWLEDNLSHATQHSSRPVLSVPCCDSAAPVHMGHHICCVIQEVGDVALCQRILLGLQGEEWSGG